MPQGDSTEVGDKPFDAAGRDSGRGTQPAAPAAPSEPADIRNGQPQPASADAMAALGLSDPAKPSNGQPAPKPQGDMSFFTPGAQPPVEQPKAQELTPQQKADMNGQQVVDQFSATIQKNSEELYALGKTRALQDPNYLPQLLNSDNEIEQKLAQKILERNAEHFGAGTVEEYKAKIELESAGDDPVQKEIAQLKMESAKNAQALKEREWKEWKAEQNISKGSEFDKLCDAVRKDYPDALWSDVVHTARGRAGINPEKYALSPESHGGGGGGSRGVQPENAGIPSDHARMFNLDQNVERAAESYFQSVGVTR